MVEINIYMNRKGQYMRFTSIFDLLYSWYSSSNNSLASFGYLLSNYLFNFRTDNYSMIKLDVSMNQKPQNSCVCPVFVQAVFVNRLFVQPVFVQSVSSNPIRLGLIRLGQYRLKQVRLGQDWTKWIGRKSLGENRLDENEFDEQ